MFIKLKFIFAVISIICSVNLTRACDCITPQENPESYLNYNELIFVGESKWQISINESKNVELESNDTRIDFKTIENIKWDKNEFISILTDGQSSCWVRTETWKQYLVFTNKDEKGEYTVNTCHVVLLSESQDILKRLQETKQETIKYSINNIKLLIFQQLQTYFFDLSIKFITTMF